jgi:hypothetical protein
VRYACARGDHQVEVGDHAGRVEPVTPLVLVAEIDDFPPEVDRVALLERDKLNARQLGERSESLEAERAACVVGLLGIAAPADTDP